MNRIIGITMGDPSGIGPEIVVKALTAHKELFDICKPVVFANPVILSDYLNKNKIDAEIVKIDKIDSSIHPDMGKIYCYGDENIKDVPAQGEINSESAQLAFKAIEDALESAMKGEISAIATAPINKEAFKKAQIRYLDHNEILAEKTNSKYPMTLFMTGNLRIFFLTKHIRFGEISAALRIDDIVLKLKNSNNYLKKLGIKHPKIAIAALNPHAGEGGMFGDDEIGVLTPAVNLSKNDGINVYGPIAADSVFHLCKEGQFDAVLSLYHDQGHIAARTLDFYKTISLSMGLPFLRTSVVHGTAMDIAGKNKANELSMVEAIKAAAKYAWDIKNYDG